MTFKRILPVVAMAFGMSVVAGSLAAGDLHKAARKGDVGAVEALLAAGADAAELDKAVGAPLHWAAARGHAQVVAILLAHGADANQAAHAPDKMTPLHMAARGGHREAAQMLLDAGADLTAGLGAVGTPLHFAAQEDHAAMMDLLLAAGADPAARSSGGAYEVFPLHWAATAGATEAVGIILATGFPVDTPNEDTGVTALHLAVFNGNSDTARLLLSAGADPDAPSTNLETPHALVKYSTDEMKAVFAEYGLN